MSHERMPGDVTYMIRAEVRPRDGQKIDSTQVLMTQAEVRSIVHSAQYPDRWIIEIESEADDRDQALDEARSVIDRIIPRHAMSSIVSLTARIV